MKKTNLLINVNGGGGNSLYIKEKKGRWSSVFRSLNTI